MIDKLDISVFEKGKNVMSLGTIPKDIIEFLSQKAPHLSNILDPNAEVLFWKDRVEHTQLHKNDFMSDNEFRICMESIPQIISNPDYLSVHPKDNSLSFIKDFSGHISVAVRLTASGKLSYRTMYPLTDAQLTNYIDRGRAWKWYSKE